MQGLSSIRKAYSKLFGEDRKRESDQLEDNARPTAFERWGWLKVIYELTDGDITKEKEYFEMNVIEFYNRLAMIRDIQAEHEDTKQALLNGKRP